MRFTRLAKGTKTHVRGQINKTESRYRDHLETLRLAGSILWYRYEGVRLRLAEGNVFYAPDFCVLGKDGTLQMHEVKAGFMDKSGKLKPLCQEAARVRLKVAADVFPFEFFLAVERPKKVGGGFEVLPVLERAA